MDVTQGQAALDDFSRNEGDAFSFIGGPLDSRDAENCFLIFLGQKPESRLLQEKVGAGVHELLRELLESSDFRDFILPPLLLREQLPHELLDTSPSLVVVDWAQSRLPIKDSTRLAVGGARTWAQLLELLLSDPMLVSISPELVTSDIQRIIRGRLEREPLFKVQRSVMGVVDSSSAFEVRGWAVDISDKATPVTLEFFADNAFLGSVSCNEPRPDVADVVGGNGHYGYTFKVSRAHRASFAGGKTLTVIDSVSKTRIGEALILYSDAAQSSDVLSDTRRELIELRKVLDRIEARLPELTHRASIPIEAYGEYWERFYRLSPSILHEQRMRALSFTFRPLISVVVPTWNSNTQLLYKAIESVRSQSYDCWELVLSDDASDRDELRSFLHRYAGDLRIRWIEGACQSGIAVNTNRGIQEAKGEYIAFLDHDDELASDALYQVVLQLQHRKYGLLYSDEDRIEEDEFGRCVHHSPYFKPGFDPELLLSLNYICHLVVVSRDIVKAIDGIRVGFEGAQDHDFLLRVVERLRNDEILHLPRVLYHWRVTPGSVSRTPQLADTIQRNIVAAVDDHLQRRQYLAKSEPHNDPLGTGRQFATRVRWSLPASPPCISIIIATRDRLELLRPCVQSVLASLDE